MLSGALPEAERAGSGPANGRDDGVHLGGQDPRRKRRHSSSHQPGFDYELLMMFAKNELSAAVTTPLLAIVVAMGAMFWSDPRELLLWLCAVFVSKGILIAVCRSFAKTPRDKADTQTWRAKITAAEFLYGVTWASVAFIGPETQSEAAHTFIFATLLVVIAMHMLFASTVMPIVYAGTLPMTAAILVRFALLDDPFYWALAAMAVGVHFYFIWLMNGFNNTVMSMLAYRAEKDTLIGELERSKAISDEARSRAEEANLAKSRFLATMSHELRTPLNAILGFSEIMRGEILGPHANPTYKEYASDIHESGQHLLALIDEILDISRIEAGRYELHETPIALGEIVEECHRLIRVRAESKDLRILQECADDLPKLLADDRAIRQICLNLLSNAIKFTPPKGTITVKIGQTAAGEQFLSVKDTGPGIPETEIPRVLRSFGQGSLAHRTAEGGTGLGLPITKGLTELHDGSFELKSRLHAGTEVIVTLPRSRNVREASRPAGHGAVFASTPQQKYERRAS